MSSKYCLGFKESSLGDGLQAFISIVHNAIDPISAVASIVGLVGAAAKVSESLFRSSEV